MLLYFIEHQTNKMDAHFLSCKSYDIVSNFVYRHFNVIFGWNQVSDNSDQASIQQARTSRYTQISRSIFLVSQDVERRLENVVVEKYRFFCPIYSIMSNILGGTTLHRCCQTFISLKMSDSLFRYCERDFLQLCCDVAVLYLFQRLF